MKEVNIPDKRTFEESEHLKRETVRAFIKKKYPQEWRDIPDWHIKDMEEFASQSQPEKGLNKNSTWEDVVRWAENNDIKQPEKQVEISDEEIEKEFPTNIDILRKNEYSSDIFTARTINLSKQEGAKWLRDKMKK